MGIAQVSRPGTATQRGSDRHDEEDIAIALLAGLVVLVLLFPASGIDPIPPQCYSAFGYVVPCADGLAVGAAIATAAMAGALLWLRDRRRT
ncbi:hypothetical protein BH20CHL7_BH20CHL7_13350 [soil metagenome]